MKYYSTNHISPPASFKEALMKGLADDGGLYMPERIPVLPKSFFDSISEKSFQEISLEVASAFLEDDIPKEFLKKIIDEAVSFDAPLISFTENIHVLELFHGPTHAFKDFGARFMAGMMSYFISSSNEKQKAECNILVATSGDTGSAVASGFYDVPGVRVYILYPSGKVSEIQEKQLTTWGKNITALEVNGTFDDCQRMVKAAFSDAQINKRMMLSSANSINIARLIPQSFYYFHAYAQLIDKARPFIFSVPSGNFGNLTAGLIAARMGLPVAKFIASTNVNNVVPLYLKSGEFKAHPSYSTISNAMDVGNPSNFARMLDLLPSVDEMRESIEGFSFTDDETREVMKAIYDRFNYVMDPHGAVASLGLCSYLMNHSGEANCIFLETAHPAKFSGVVEDAVKIKVAIPPSLEKYIAKEKAAISIANRSEELKEFLLAI